MSLEKIPNFRSQSSQRLSAVSAAVATHTSAFHTIQKICVRREVVHVSHSTPIDVKLLFWL